MDKEPLKIRPHHLERVAKYVTWGELGEEKAKNGELDSDQLRSLDEEKTMFESLTSALADDPEATVVFVKDFDSLCKRFCDPSACVHHQAIIETDEAVKDALGLELDRPYRIVDVLNALKIEKNENPRTYFAISRGHEKIPEWRESVRKLSLRAIESN